MFGSSSRDFDRLFRTSRPNWGLRAVIFVGAIILYAFVVQWAWWSIVPDVYAGMVQAGYLPATLDYSQGFTVSLMTMLTFLLILVAYKVFDFISDIIRGFWGLALGIVVGLLIISWFQSFSWATVVPAVVPVMVEKGLLPATIGIWAAFKLLIVPIIMIVFGRIAWGWARSA